MKRSDVNATFLSLQINPFISSNVAMEGRRTATFLSSPINDEQSQSNRRDSENQGSATVTFAEREPTMYGDQFASTSVSAHSENVLSKSRVYQKPYSPEVLVETAINSTDLHSLSTFTWHDHEISSNGRHDSPQPSNKELNGTNDGASHQVTLIDPTINIANVPIKENKIPSQERPKDHDDLISGPATSHSEAKSEPAQSEDCYHNSIGEEKFSPPQVSPAELVFSTNNSNLSIEHGLLDISIPTASQSDANEMLVPLPSENQKPSLNPSNVVETRNRTQAVSAKIQTRSYKRKSKIQSNERIGRNGPERNSNGPAKLNENLPTRNKTPANSKSTSVGSVASLKRKNLEKSQSIPVKKFKKPVEGGTAVTDILRDKQNEQNSAGQSYAEFVKFLCRNDVSVRPVPQEPSPFPTKSLPVPQEPSNIDWAKYREIFKRNRVTIERVSK
ncbi:hypothetical protein HA402_012849 [Bradysia odoriphaga]|nr:hypothetical protein HA402_012849 [Bradysia odoriphaga]